MSRIHRRGLDGHAPAQLAQKDGRDGTGAKSRGRIAESMPGQFEVMIERNFSSAHQLRGYKGKCENLHGHNYRIEIYARGRELEKIGLLVDFVELKAAADEG